MLVFYRTYSVLNSLGAMMAVSKQQVSLGITIKNNSVILKGMIL